MGKKCNPEVVEIDSLENFIREISNVKEDISTPFGIRKLYYRGQNDVEYELIPSIGRATNSFIDDNWQIAEAPLIEAVQQRFPDTFNERKYPMILLAKLQHYGVDTRLLDMTKNSLVALYFACKGNEDKDGEVFVFEGVSVSAYNPFVNAIADTYRLASPISNSINDFYYRVMKQPYFSSRTFPNWEREKPKYEILENLFVNYFVEVGSVLERQKNQHGCFILFHNLCDDGYMRNELKKIEKDSPIIKKRIIISSSAKKDLINQLKRFGVSKEFLFADDVDNVIEVIKGENKKRFIAFVK